MATPTVLVLDSELGFIFALSHELSQRHISAFPARTTQEARSLMTRFRVEPDLLVINCAIRGACSFAESIAKEHDGLAIVGIVSERHKCKRCADRLVSTLRDPEDEDPYRVPYCADLIHSLLREQRRRRSGIARGN